jgi:hypothetical protein
MRDDHGSLAPPDRLAVRDQVRVAYGAVPVILEGLPADDPFRTMLRDRARSWLVTSGALTAEELDTVPLSEAVTTALRRLRA